MGILILKSLFVRDGIFVLNTVKDPDLIKSIVLFFNGQTDNFYLFKHIDAIIVQTFGFRDRGVSVPSPSYT